MLATKRECEVLEHVWLTPTVMRIRFRCAKVIKFQGGQFLSVVVPDVVGGGKPVKRAYSFASSPEEGRDGVYELCVKYQAGGLGSEFLASLKPGDKFTAQAPYGHYLYHARPGHNACFISTSTGVAPNRSIVLSEEFRAHPPEKTLFLYGASFENEIIYPETYPGVEVVNCISRAGEGFAGFRGRVTDYLRGLPVAWQWHTTDFYICGNAQMISEVREILTGGHGVQPARIHAESFFPKKSKSA